MAAHDSNLVTTYRVEEPGNPYLMQIVTVEADGKMTCTCQQRRSCYHTEQVRRGRAGKPSVRERINTDNVDGAADLARRLLYN